MYNDTNIQTELDADGILVARIDMQGRTMNVFSRAMMDSLDALMSFVSGEAAVKGVVLTSGKSAFLAGADLDMIRVFTERAKVDAVPELNQLFGHLGRLFRRLELSSKPYVAAINGLALGGGLEVALACHARVVLDDEKAVQLGLPEIKLGLLPGFAVVRLADIVGRPKAKEMSILGDPISAEEAVRLGLALRTVAPERLMEEAMAMAEKIASKPQMAVRMAKSFYNRGLGGDDLRAARDAFPFLFMPPDAREGVTAFREKRKPKFS